MKKNFFVLLSLLAFFSCKTIPDNYQVSDLESAGYKKISTKFYSYIENGKTHIVSIDPFNGEKYDLSKHLINVKVTLTKDAEFNANYGIKNWFSGGTDLKSIKVSGVDNYILTDKDLVKINESVVKINNGELTIPDSIVIDAI